MICVVCISVASLLAKVVWRFSCSRVRVTMSLCLVESQRLLALRARVQEKQASEFICTFNVDPFDPYVLEVLTVD